MTKTFITAGAGSGKTYRITTDVAKMVNDKNIGVKPDQVIMTTFTKAAAQELREKAKKELVNLGLHDEAQQMEAREDELLARLGAGSDLGEVTLTRHEEERS